MKTSDKTQVGKWIHKTKRLDEESSGKTPLPLNLINNWFTPPPPTLFFLKEQREESRFHNLCPVAIFEN